MSATERQKGGRATLAEQKQRMRVFAPCVPPAVCRVNGFGRPRITGQKTAEKKARGKPGRVDRAPPFVYTAGIRMLREARS